MGTSFSAPVQTSLPYNGYRVCFPGICRLRRDVTTHPHLEPGFKVRVEFYLCSLSGLSWPVMGRSLPFLPYSRYGLLGCDFVLFGRWVIINASEKVLPPSSWQKMWREQLSSRQW